MDIKQTNSYKIDINDDESILTAPFDEQLHSFIKNLGGSWSKKHWKIPNDKLEEVSRKLYSYYGSGEGISISIDLIKLKVKKTLNLFGRELISVNQYDNSYSLHSSLIISKGEIPNNWIYKKNLSNNDFNCYFAKKLAYLMEPFILKDTIILITNIGLSQLNDLKILNYNWIKQISRID